MIAQTVIVSLTAKNSSSVGIWGWLGGECGLLTFYSDRKDNFWTQNILSLLDIASRFVALCAAWKVHWETGLAEGHHVEGHVERICRGREGEGGLRKEIHNLEVKVL